MQYKFIEKLIVWYRSFGESYFFRKERTPYKVWVSEVVLSQTRIQAALGPLENFLSKFPDLKALASATEEEVLLAFRGLGYYARGKNLRKGANYILEYFHGQFPSEPHLLQTIPSIGPYTASMIASLCYGKKIPALDGNIKRVLARFLMIPYPLNHSSFINKAQVYLEDIFSKLKFSPGDLNEAMMELGQKICLRSSPLCQQAPHGSGNCPISMWCAAYQQCLTNQYPVLKKKTEKIAVHWHLFIIRDSNNFIWLERWRDFYFLKGQVGFPSILEIPAQKKFIASWNGNDEMADTEFSELMEKLKASWTLPFLKHTITRHKIKIFPYLLPEKSARKILSAKFEWNSGMTTGKNKLKSRQKFCATPEVSEFRLWKVSSGKIQDYLVSSAMIKAWQKAEGKMKQGANLGFSPNSADRIGQV